MRCPECQQEVVLARTCPYCGAAVPQPEDERAQRTAEGEDHPRGRFHGRLEHEGAAGGSRTAEASEERGTSGFLARLARYMLHPRVPLRSKALVVLGALYLLSPLDLLPGLFPLSWIDDLSLLGFLWWWLHREFEQYR